MLVSLEYFIQSILYFFMTHINRIIISILWINKLCLGCWIRKKWTSFSHFWTYYWFIFWTTFQIKLFMKIIYLTLFHYQKLFIKLFELFFYFSIIFLTNFRLNIQLRFNIHLLFFLYLLVPIGIRWICTSIIHIFWVFWLLITSFQTLF